MKLVAQNYQKKLLFPRNTCSLKSSSSEKVAVLKKYPFRKRTCFEYIYSEEKAPPKQHLFRKSDYLQEVVDQKKKYQEVVIYY